MKGNNGEDDINYLSQLYTLKEYINQQRDRSVESLKPKWDALLLDINLKISNNE